METPFGLLALCEGNPPVTGRYISIHWIAPQRAINADIFFVIGPDMLLNNPLGAGDSRCSYGDAVMHSDGSPVEAHVIVWSFIADAVWIHHRDAMHTYQKLKVIIMTTFPSLSAKEVIMKLCRHRTPRQPPVSPVTKKSAPWQLLGFSETPVRRQAIIWTSCGLFLIGP